MSTSILPGERPDRLEEECAVFGVFAPGEDVARMTCFGLQALQHRGQESAGIAVGDGETIMASKDLGLVTQVFDEASLAALTGFVAVGHARYSTSGAAASWEAAQPHISAIDETLIALAHNGTLVNTNSLRARLIDDGIQLRSGTDSEVAAKAIGDITKKTHHLREGIRFAMEHLKGAPTASTPSATRTASARCAWASFPTIAAGSFPPRPADSISWARNTCAT